jgi:NAD(P)-dependent dehydrogenase (short-subunit alcohol dehydrogenase family)
MSSELFSFAGDVALVTGAGQGLGRVIALGLAEHESAVFPAARASTVATWSPSLALVGPVPRALGGPTPGQR